MRALKLDEFADHVGERYALHDGERSFEFTLESANELPRSLPDSDAFRLTWRGPSEPVLSQSIYRIERDGDSCEMFIVPVARDDRGTEYEAIFT